MKEDRNRPGSDRRSFLIQATGLAAAGVVAPHAFAKTSGPPAGPEQEEVSRSAIQRLRIPRTGELVPVIGLGTARTFDADPDSPPEALVTVMDRFLQWGGSLVDSSPMYGRAEAVVGALCRAVGRRDLFYATKVWTKEGKQAGIEQMGQSGRRMGTRR
ncbi:MAG: aldo/keto reductase, partial [Planctomycetota bacterium]